jgi:hypothetical protein
VLSYGDINSLEYAVRRWSQAAIPHTKRVQGNGEKVRALLLRQVCIATQLTERIHVFTMPFSG